MSACVGCDVPEPFKPDSYAFIWPPQGHSLYKLASYLDEQDYAFDNLLDANCVRVFVPNVNKFVVQVTGLLTEPERRNTRILITQDKDPGLKAFGLMMTVGDIANRLRGQWLIHMLEQDRLTSFAQPIVHAADDSVFGHEMLVRGLETDGSIVSPGALFESASDPQIFFSLDKQARISAVRTAAKYLPEGMVFINFMPGSVYDPEVCLRTTVQAAMECEIDPSRIVFEIVESDRFDDLTHLNGIVQFYRNAGFRIALDDFGAGFNNLSTFLALQPDFIKLDKSITQQVARSADKREVIGAFLKEARKVQTKVLAEGVETDEVAETLRTLGVDFLQGYHFGRPTRLDADTVSAAA